eukprot:gene8350-53053_t
MCAAYWGAVVYASHLDGWRSPAAGPVPATDSDDDARSPHTPRPQPQADTPSPSGSEGDIPNTPSSGHRSAGSGAGGSEGG